MTHGVENICCVTLKDEVMLVVAQSVLDPIFSSTTIAILNPQKLNCNGLPKRQKRVCNFFHCLNLQHNILCTQHNFVSYKYISYIYYVSYTIHAL